ncbi:Histidine kinase [Saccharopolyspora antimicrobica]|uniref:histidine kinase n=1 Tax=Saccharopolyspora antimicrobica TaxID=455193 RepID=A0A1I5F0K8_9PSEU|nr:histidine kinase [Saccharopolyspora antimicrobica]RKT83619.1 histidine kinase [Saccharopolyspora antimicrobica]SFO17169.1 Histidine kinase [Saccharopolyspora antimicrobica]
MQIRIAPAIVVVLLVTVQVFGKTQADIGSSELAVDIAVGVLACVLALGVWRWPIPTALGLAGLATLAITATPAATMATAVVACKHRIGTASWVALAGVAGHAVLGLWRPMPGLPYSWWLVLDVITHAALVGWGSLIKARLELINSLKERARRAEAEQGRRIAEARAAERTALAREMHDVLAHRLSLVATYSGALEYRQDANPAQLAKAAGVIRDGVHQALDELREVITVLRDDTAQRPHLGIDDLPALIAETRETGTDVDFSNSTTAAPPPPTGRTTYRIIQEGLTNARKHAPGQPVRITLTGAPGDSLRVSLSNPAPDVDAAIPGTGTGLVGLTERVRLTGGHLDHELTATGEFVLQASLPWPT